MFHLLIEVGTEKLPRSNVFPNIDVVIAGVLGEGLTDPGYHLFT